MLFNAIQRHSTLFNSYWVVALLETRIGFRLVVSWTPVLVASDLQRGLWGCSVEARGACRLMSKRSGPVLSRETLDSGSRSCLIWERGWGTLIIITSAPSLARPRPARLPRRNQEVQERAQDPILGFYGELVPSFFG